MYRFDHFLPLLLAVLPITNAVAQQPRDPKVESNDKAVSAQKPTARVLEALASVSQDARTFNEHIVVLSSTFMEGRLPGTRGMELAKEYMIFHFKKAGLQPGFGPAPSGAEPSSAWRQPFPHGGTRELKAESLQLDGTEFTKATDYVGMLGGGSSKVTGELVCVGYSVRSGPDDYASYLDEDDLTGKIALMLRFEPSDATGKSKWIAGNQPWSRRAGYAMKIREALRHKVAGIIVVNPPGVADPRAKSIDRGGSQSLIGRRDDVPILMMSTEAASRLVEKASGGKHTLDKLKATADERGGVTFLGGKATIETKIEAKTLRAENVGGLLPGRGALKGELIVFGAHLDHLGLGAFGSRDQQAGRVLHPGADDNASGSAAILMIAAKMAAEYARLPQDQPLRSVLFIGFSAEESGLHGSRYYVNNLPGYKHALMINFDMIGRVQNGRITVGGVDSANGMREWVQKVCAESPLQAQIGGGGIGGSDHASFYSKQIPVLFGHSGLHADYHTSRDSHDLINREGGAMVVDLFSKIGLHAAARTEPFEFRAGTGNQPRRGQ